MMMFSTMDLLSPTMMSVSRIEKNKNIRELKKVRKERKKKEEKTPSEIKKNRLDFFFLTVILLRSNEFEQRVLIRRYDARWYKNNICKFCFNIFTMIVAFRFIIDSFIN